MFYGCEHSDLKPTNGEFAFVGSLGGLYRLLLGCWRRETCAPRLQEKWSESNPTCGQCSITSFLVQDIFGGEVYGVPNGDGKFEYGESPEECALREVKEETGLTMTDLTEKTLATDIPQPKAVRKADALAGVRKYTGKIISVDSKTLSAWLCWKIAR